MKLIVIPHLNAPLGYEFCCVKRSKNKVECFRKVPRVIFPSSMLPTALLASLLPLVVLLSLPTQVTSIKFNLPASRYPAAKCIWNTAHTNALVIVTANVAPGASQRVDIEIIDSSPQRNVYLSKRGIDGEARLAITTHEEGEVGVCLRNYVEGGKCTVRALHCRRS